MPNPVPSDSDAALAAFDAFDSTFDDTKSSGSYVPDKKVTLNVEINELATGSADRWKKNEDIPWFGFRYTVADGEQQGRVIFGFKNWAETEPPKDDKVKEIRARQDARNKANFEAILGQPIPKGTTRSEVIAAVQAHIKEHGPLLASVSFFPSTNKKTGFISLYDDIKRLLS